MLHTFLYYAQAIFVAQFYQSAAGQHVGRQLCVQVALHVFRRTGIRQDKSEYLPIKMAILCQLQARQPDALLKYFSCVARHGAGTHAAHVAVMRHVAHISKKFPLIKYRRYHDDIGQMVSSPIRVVDHVCVSTVHLTGGKKL